LVVTRVVGRRVFQSMGESWATTRPERSEGSRDVQGPGDWLLFRGRRFGFFPPGWSASSSIEHAWDVVERMRELGYGFVSRATPTAGKGERGVYAARFARTGGVGVGEPDAWVESRVGMPHAICLAALRALGVTTPDA